MRCSFSTPRSPPWPGSSTFPGTASGMRPELKRPGGWHRPAGRPGVDGLGVDEHVWFHTGPPGTGMATGIVAHTREANGMVHARLPDLVPGRSGKACANWLKDRGAGFTAGTRTAARGPFQWIRQRHPRRVPRSDHRTGRVPCREAGVGHDRRGPPPGPAGHPRAQRPQGRSALRNPQDLRQE